jgi:Spy/CpxP family protein refolding chaperone
MSRFPWFYDSLGLSDRQRASIDSIMRANRPRTDQVMASIMPQLRAISDSTRLAIDAVLTPEQLAKLKAMPKRDFRRGPGFGPPGSDRDERRGPRK